MNVWGYGWICCNRATEERESGGRKRRKYDNDYLKCSWIGSEDAPKPAVPNLFSATDRFNDMRYFHGPVRE